ncbi:hypothetical protein OG458_42250 (plasmid) [Streptomyces sp. NBC_01281]|uniref:hypothetical protein n=1 Tax=Streptomyces sp. NBC_01281 TaxID=2903811 RepID=UPI002E11BEB7|nr:hypothetical protein OG458_42250 [Streptomyces sp. NBC_01281]
MKTSSTHEPASGSGKQLVLHPDWYASGHPETFRFEATVLGPDLTIAGVHHRFDLCGCTAHVYPANSIVDGTSPATVFTPRGPWTVAGQFDLYEHPNSQYEQWGENDEYSTLAEAETAARDLHLRVCSQYQRAAGTCATCGDPAAAHATDEPRWCSHFYFGDSCNAEIRGPAHNRP